MDNKTIILEVTIANDNDYQDLHIKDNNFQSVNYGDSNYDNGMTIDSIVDCFRDFLLSNKEVYGLK